MSVHFYTSADKISWKKLNSPREHYRGTVLIIVFQLSVVKYPLDRLTSVTRDNGAPNEHAINIAS